jgi:hypothetical protein
MRLRLRFTLNRQMPFRIVKERANDSVSQKYRSNIEIQYLICILETGGASRDRTDDPLLAKQVLSQLSYGPILVGLGGFEPPTSPLSGVRSNQLSYRPELCLM